VTQVDGIPLAVELAAVRVQALSVEQISDRLRDSLRLLTGGSSSSPPRHRTLRATLDWSFGLLEHLDQVALRRLAVFAGGWSLEAAEAVCAGEDVNPDDVLDLLTRLVDKSLVVADVGGGAARYSVQETVRAYAWEKLHTSVEEPATRSRHRDWYLQIAERFAAEFRGPRQHIVVEEVEREEANIRAALRWCVEHGDATEGFRICSALAYEFWEYRGRVGEGREWLAQLLALASPSVPESLLAEGLTAAGLMAAYQGDDAAARAQLLESLAIRRRVGDPAGLSRTLRQLATAAQHRGDLDGSPAFLEEWLILARSTHDRVGTYIALHQMANNAVADGDYALAEALQAESLALKQQQGDAVGTAHSLYVLSNLAWIRGDALQAMRLLEEVLVISQEPSRRGALLGGCLELLAEITSRRGDACRATRLHGAADTLRERYGRRMVVASVGSAQARREASLATAREVLTSSVFDALWAEGRGMSTEEAIAFALDSTSHSGE
jgi:non-specific serine/threonine protein kinase